jgi:hypothetical protein
MGKRSVADAGADHTSRLPSDCEGARNKEKEDASIDGHDSPGAAAVSHC